MSQTERMRRASVVGLMALALTAGLAIPAGAQNPPAEPKVSALPEPLTRDSVRELVARLSDDEVRKLLLDQLDRAAAAAAVPAKAETGMAGMVEHNAGMMRGQVAALEDALIGLPSILRNVGAKLTEPDGASRLLWIAGLLAAILVAARSTSCPTAKSSGCAIPAATG